MTIGEALKESQQSGKAYSRRGGDGYGGWIKYHETHQYRHLYACDLMADDWAPDSENIEALTDGRWTTVENAK